MIRIPRPLTAAFLSALLVAVGGLLQSAVAQVPDGAAVALTGARLFDGTGRAPHEQSVLVIRNGRIEMVGALGDVDIPDDAERIDLSGKTILPGFVHR